MHYCIKGNDQMGVLLNEYQQSAILHAPQITSYILYLET